MKSIYKALLNPLTKGEKNQKEFGDRSSSIEASSDSWTPLYFSFEFEYPDKILLLEIIDDAAITLAPAKAIHVSSSRLIERSPFFRKLFSNGMRESEQEHVTLRIEASEEVPFMNLLRFVYSRNKNLPTALRDLLNLLVIADKYDVASCMEECTLSLSYLLTTCETALLYLYLAPNLVMSKQLIDKAKLFLALSFSDLRRSKKEMLNLPLLAIQAILSSNFLEVTSEAEVFDVIMKWAQKHYPDLEERREILETHLLYLVRFPFMTTKELMKRLDSYYINRGYPLEIVTRPLCFKTKAPLRLSSAVASCQFVSRASLSLQRLHLANSCRVRTLED